MFRPRHEASQPFRGMVRNDSRNGKEGFRESFRTILHTPKKASESAIGTFLPFIGITLKKEYNYSPIPSPLNRESTPATRARPSIPPPKS